MYIVIYNIGFKTSLQFLFLDFTQKLRQFNVLIFIDNNIAINLNIILQHTQIE